MSNYTAACAISICHHFPITGIFAILGSVLVSGILQVLEHSFCEMMRLFLTQSMKCETRQTFIA